MQDAPRASFAQASRKLEASGAGYVAAMTPLLPSPPASGRAVHAWLCLALSWCACGSAAALTLSEAERDLAARNRDIGLAAIEARGAEADVQTAARRPPLQLGLDIGKISTRNGIGPGGFADKRIDSTLGLSYTLERGGKRRWRTEQARGLSAAARFTLANTQRLQALALHTAYYTLKRSEEQRALAQANQETAEQALAAADRRLTAGDLAPVERARLAVDALKLVDEARAAEQEHRQAQQELAVLIGREREATTLSADDAWPELDEDVPAGSPEALGRRPDQRAAAAQVDAAEAGRRLAQSLRRRDVDVGFGVEREPTDQAGVTWGVSVSVPLVGPGYHRGEVARAEADYDSAVLSRDKARAEAEAELALARSALASARDRLRHFESDIVPAARQALDGVEFAWTHGAADLTDLLDARRAWREAASDLIDARSGYALALAQWRAVAPTADTEETSQ